MDELIYSPFKNINVLDPFFDSLKRDYKEFPDWFRRKREEDHYAYIHLNNESMVDAFLYLKREDDAIEDIEPHLPAKPRIKIGTMKIDSRGTRMGERFIKKALDYSTDMNIDEIYVTAFEKHNVLINLYERYGFKCVAQKTTPNGTENVYIKSLEKYESPKLSYPLVKVAGNRIFLLAIMPMFHSRLFPDSILKSESPQELIRDVSHTNSIQKVYLSAAHGAQALKNGDVIVIYRTGDDLGPAEYRAVATSICVVEKVESVYDFKSEKDFLDATLSYSVFNEVELRKFYRTKKYPHIIHFTYNLAFAKKPIRKELADTAGLDRNKRWTLLPLSQSQFEMITKMAECNERLIIY